MKTLTTSFLALLLFSLLFLGKEFLGPSRAVASPTMEITVFEPDHTVRVNLKEAPLRKVLGQFSKQFHLKIWISPKAAEQRLTDQFTGLPLDKALQRLLHGRNYALLFSGTNTKGEVAGIYVLSPDSGNLTNSEPLIPFNNAQLQAEIQAHPPDIFPPDVRKALLELTARDINMEEDAKAKRMEAVTMLIKLLETAGPGESEITRQLQEHLRKQQQ